MTGRRSTITRLSLGALTAAGLAVGVAGPALAATPAAATSSTFYTPTGRTASTQVSKNLAGKARIVDGRFTIAPGLLR
jgi:hypothetical protein